jgi:hypothetical protein
VKPVILIVGEDHFLSETRAQILRDWETVITYPMYAPQVIQARFYDLVIFCHTVSDSVAEEIMTSATSLYPGVKFLAIDEVLERRLGPNTFSVEAFNPRHLLDAVAGILNSNVSAAVR